MPLDRSRLLVAALENVLHDQLTEVGVFEGLDRTGSVLSSSTDLLKRNN